MMKVDRSKLIKKEKPLKGLFFFWRGSGTVRFSDVHSKALTLNFLILLSFP